MAKTYIMSAKQACEWAAWKASRPKIIQQLAEQFPIDRLYRILATGERCEIRSYLENGTITVYVTGKYNLVSFDTLVFGLKPSDLGECDLPKSDEIIGTLLTDPDRIQALIQIQRKRMGLA